MTDHAKVYKSATFKFRLEKEFLLEHDDIKKSSPMSVSRYLADVARSVERKRKGNPDYNIDEDTELSCSGLLSKLSVKLQTDPEYLPCDALPNIDNDDDDDDVESDDSDNEDAFFDKLRSFFEHDYRVLTSASQPREELVQARVTNIRFDRESRMSEHAAVYVEVEATFDLLVLSTVGKDDLTWCEYMFDFEVDDLGYDDNWDVEGEDYWAISDCEWDVNPPPVKTGGF